MHSFNHFSTNFFLSCTFLKWGGGYFSGNLFPLTPTFVQTSLFLVETVPVVSNKHLTINLNSTFTGQCTLHNVHCFYLRSLDKTFVHYYMLRFVIFNILSKCFLFLTSINYLYSIYYYYRFISYTKVKWYNMIRQKQVFIYIFKTKTSIGIYIYIWLVCLSVCLYPINVKTAEPIGSKFFVGHHAEPIGPNFFWDIT